MSLLMSLPYLAMTHVILGFTKKIYEWILKLYARLEELEEGKTAGNTTHHFRQGIVKARDNAIKYCEFLKIEYQSVVDSVEGKKQQSLIFQLNTLRAECEKNKTTPEEERPYEDFVSIGCRGTDGTAL